MTQEQQTIFGEWKEVKPRFRNIPWVSTAYWIAKQTDRPVFVPAKKLWVIEMDNSMYIGKGTKMGLTQNMRLADKLRPVGFLDGMAAKLWTAPFIGAALTGGNAIELIEVRSEVEAVVRVYGILRDSGRKVIVKGSAVTKYAKRGDA